MSLICGGMNVKFLKSENEKPPVIKSMIKCAPVRHFARAQSQPAKIDLNKKSLPKQKTIQNFTIDA